MLQVDQLIAPTTIGLPYLQELELSNMHWHQFSGVLAGALNSLSLLDLSGQDLTHLPPAISQITTLHTLNLSFTSSLLLQHSDVNVLAALPSLKSLEVSLTRDVPENADMWQSMMRVLSAIRARLPLLKLPGYGDCRGTLQKVQQAEGQ